MFKSKDLEEKIDQEKEQKKEIKINREALIDLRKSMKI